MKLILLFLLSLCSVESRKAALRASTHLGLGSRSTGLLIKKWRLPQRVDHLVTLKGCFGPSCCVMVHQVHSSGMCELVAACEGAGSEAPDTGSTSESVSHLDTVIFCAKENVLSKHSFGYGAVIGSQSLKTGLVCDSCLAPRVSEYMYEEPKQSSGIVKQSSSLVRQPVLPALQKPAEVTVLARTDAGQPAAAEPVTAQPQPLFPGQTMPQPAPVDMGGLHHEVTITQNAAPPTMSSLVFPSMCNGQEASPCCAHVDLVLPAMERCAMDMGESAGHAGQQVLDSARFCQAPSCRATLEPLLAAIPENDNVGLCGPLRRFATSFQQLSGALCTKQSDGFCIEEIQTSAHKLIEWTQSMAPPPVPGEVPMHAPGDFGVDDEWSDEAWSHDEGMMSVPLPPNAQYNHNGSGGLCLDNRPGMVGAWVPCEVLAAPAPAPAPQPAAAALTSLASKVHESRAFSKIKLSQTRKKLAQLVGGMMSPTLFLTRLSGKQGQPPDFKKLASHVKQPLDLLCTPCFRGVFEAYLAIVEAAFVTIQDAEIARFLQDQIGHESLQQVFSARIVQTTLLGEMCMKQDDADGDYCVAEWLHSEPSILRLDVLFDESMQGKALCGSGLCGKPFAHFSLAVNLGAEDSERPLTPLAQATLITQDACGNPGKPDGLKCADLFAAKFNAGNSTQARGITSEMTEPSRMLLQKCNTGDGACSDDCKKALAQWKLEYGCCSQELFTKAMLISNETGILVSPEAYVWDRQLLFADPQRQYKGFAEVFASWATSCFETSYLRACHCSKKESVGLSLPLPKEVKMIPVSPVGAPTWKRALRQDLARTIQEDATSVKVEGWSLSKTGSALDVIVNVVTPGCEQTSKMAELLRDRINTSTLLLTEWNEVVASAMPANEVKVTNVSIAVKGTLTLTGIAPEAWQGDQRPQFESKVKQSIAAAAAVSPEQVTIKDMRAGSVLVDYEVETSDKASSTAISKSLVAQAGSANSALALHLKTHLGAAAVIDPLRSGAQPEEKVEVSSGLDVMMEDTKPLEVQSGIMRPVLWKLCLCVTLVQASLYLVMQ